MVVLPLVPDLVVTIMAPLFALAPYSAAALAPFSTLIEAMSSGDRLLISPPSGTPSTTYNAWLLPEIERLPRNTTFEATGYTVARPLNGETSDFTL